MMKLTLLVFTLPVELETLKQEKEVVDGKLAGLLSASKNLENLIESQGSDKSKEECADDTVTDYSRPSPTVESSSKEDQNRNPSASKSVASPITSKKFPTANKKLSTASRKFPTGSTKGPTADMGMKGKAVKPSADPIVPLILGRPFLRTACALIDVHEIESGANFDDDSFDSEGEKIKEAELLIDPLDLSCDILFEYDSFNSQDFSRDDVLPSPDNEDK
nr:hypothetical protein [Tanacetum cinerariifolium]